jgi:hypothetical protein
MENFLDGNISESEMEVARQAARDATRESLGAVARFSSEAAVEAVSRGDGARFASNHAGLALRYGQHRPLLITTEEEGEICRAENRAQADLLREIVGNPFRRVVTPDHWPAAVVQLAEAHYNGADCAFALHDALLEAGCPELAHHFRSGQHPKGCWVVDLILGKT